MVASKKTLKVVLVEPAGPINVGSVARLCENFNVHEREKIVIRVLGDENTYQLRIKDNHLNDYSYVMEFSSNKEDEIEFNLSDFKPIFRGTYLNLENFNKNQISEIAFMIVSNKEPTFKLKIWSPNPEPITP